MSNINNEINDGLDAAWGDRQEDASQFGARDDGGHFSSVEKDRPIDEQNSAVLDVAETVAEKKSGSPVGLIIAVVGGLFVLGVAGYIGMKLYSKIAPAKSSYVQSDRSSELKDGQGQLEGGMLIPGGSDVSNPTAESSATAALVAGAASPVVANVQNETSKGSVLGGTREPAINEATSAIAVQSPMITAVSSPAAVSMTSAGHETEKSSQIKSPQDMTPKQATANVTCPVVEAQPVAKKKVAPRARSHANASATDKKNQSSKVAKKKPQKESAKKTDTAAEPAKENMASSANRPRSTGSLHGYKLMSIWPKTGEFQQATVKDASGANHVLRAGDRIAGVRVQSVNAASYEVETDAGFIR